MMEDPKKKDPKKIDPNERDPNKFLGIGLATVMVCELCGVALGLATNIRAFFLIGGIAAVVFFILSITYWTCPCCGKYLPVAYGLKVCPYCGHPFNCSEDE